MKHETWLFVICTVFLVLVTPAYWLITNDWTGTSALTMTTLLTLMVSLYLGCARRPHDASPRGPQGRRDRRRRR